MWQGLARCSSNPLHLLPGYITGLPFPASLAGWSRVTEFWPMTCVHKFYIPLSGRLPKPSLKSLMHCYFLRLPAGCWGSSGGLWGPRRWQRHCMEEARLPKQTVWSRDVDIRLWQEWEKDFYFLIHCNISFCLLTQLLIQLYKQTGSEQNYS